MFVAIECRGLASWNRMERVDRPPIVATIPVGDAALDAAFGFVVILAKDTSLQAPMACWTCAAALERARDDRVSAHVKTGFTTD